MTISRSFHVAAKAIILFFFTAENVWLPNQGQKRQVYTMEKRQSLQSGAGKTGQLHMK